MLKRKCSAWMVLIPMAAMLGLPSTVHGQQVTDEETLKAQQEMLKVMEQMREGGADPADYRRYEALMPSTLLGLERGDCEGQNQEVQGMATSASFCTYGDSEKRVDVRMSDMGNMGQMALMSQFGLTLDIDVQSDTGFERTTTVGGFRAMHTWYEPARLSKLMLLLGDRGMMEIKAFETASNGAVDAARSLPLNQFARLASAK